MVLSLCSRLKRDPIRQNDDKETMVPVATRRDTASEFLLAVRKIICRCDEQSRELLLYVLQTVTI